MVVLETSLAWLLPPTRLSERRLLVPVHSTSDYFLMFQNNLIFGSKLDPAIETDQNLPLWLHVTQKYVAKVIPQENCD